MSAQVATGMNWLLQPPATAPVLLAPPLALALAPVPHRYVSHTHKRASDSAEMRLLRSFSSETASAVRPAEGCARHASQNTGSRGSSHGRALSNSALPSSVNAALFEDVPQEIILQILTCLTPRELCAVAQTCHLLRRLADDSKVWRRLLLREMPLWPTVGSSTLPGHQALFFNTKHTYLTCSPESKSPRARHTPTAAAAGPGLLLSRSLTSLFWEATATGEVVICGYGLEHAGTGLISQLLYGEQSPFTVTGMTAGNNGVGGGVSVQHGRTGAKIDLISVHHRRYRRQHVPFPPSSRDPAATASAMVFVCDADRLDPGHPDHVHYMREAAKELHHMIPRAGVPLLVVSLVPALRTPPPLLAPPLPLPNGAAVVNAAAVLQNTSNPSSRNSNGGSTSRQASCHASATDVAGLLQLGSQARAWRVITTQVKVVNPNSTMQQSDYLSDGTLHIGLDWLCGQMPR